MENALHSAYREIVLVNKEYFFSLMNDMNEAKKSIDLETYIFANDTIGNQVIEALSHAAMRGVKVRLLLDGVGSYHWNSELIIKMQQVGVEVKMYHPLFWSFSHWQQDDSFFKLISHLLKNFNIRNHRKTCVIDNKIAYIGSANISEGVYQGDNLVEWYDVTIKIIGAKLEELQFAFNKAWGCLSFKNQMKSIFHLNPHSIFRLNFSWRQKRNLYKDLLLKIKSSKKRIWITNAYFIPKKFLLLQLIKAANAGIDVRIILPSHPDVIGVSLIAQSFYSILLKSGVSIMQHLPGVLHAKILILDDWFCVGSSNLNHRSVKYDLEVDVCVQTPQAKKRLEEIFHDYSEQAKKIREEDIKPSFLEKIITWMLLLFKRWS